MDTIRIHFYILGISLCCIWGKVSSAHMAGPPCPYVSRTFVRHSKIKQKHLSLCAPVSNITEYAEQFLETCTFFSHQTNTFGKCQLRCNQDSLCVASGYTKEGECASCQRNADVNQDYKYYDYNMIDIERFAVFIKGNQ